MIAYLVYTDQEHLFHILEPRVLICYTELTSSKKSNNIAITSCNDQ